MVQEVIVGIIVLIATWAVIMHFTPLRLRHTARNRLAQLANRCGWRWLESKLTVPTHTAATQSNACGNCTACSPPAANKETVSTITPDRLKRTIRR